jgi:hypothetical protein
MRIIGIENGCDVNYDVSSIATLCWHDNPRLDGIWEAFYSGVFAFTAGCKIWLATFQGHYGDEAREPATRLVAAITAAAANGDKFFDVDAWKRENR